VTFAYRGSDPLAEYRENPPDTTHPLIVDRFNLKMRDKKLWRTIPITTVSSAPAPSIRCLVETTENQICIALPLSKLPKKELRLEVAALAWLQYRIPKGGVKPQLTVTPQTNKLVVVSPSTKSKGSDEVQVRLTSPVAFVTARKDGEPAPEPRVSRARSISLISTEVTPLSPLLAERVTHFSNANSQIEVKLQKQTTGQEQAQPLKWKIIDPHLVDDRGKKYFTWRAKSSIPLEPSVMLDQAFELNGPIYNSTRASNEDAIYTFNGYYSVASIPINAGQLTFKTQISVNDEWPLPVSVAVRERNKSIYP
jgi:hypothetical protein